MFANFTEETCTGTGATLALAGITTGNIPFSKSFADGDLVAYVLEDSGGVIKIAGVGTYVSATDDITRNDTWNWNGTVIDDNPSSNITLSGGTHTVRCDVIGNKIGAANILRSGLNIGSRFITSPGADGGDAGSGRAIVNTKIYHIPIIIPANTTIDAITMEVTSAVASSLSRVGIVSVDKNGEVVAVLGESANIDTSTTGIKTGTITSVFFPVETVVYAWCSSDSAISVQFRGRNDYNYHPMLNTLEGSSGRTRPTSIMAVASGQPVYPTPVTLNTINDGDMIDLYVRYT